MTLKLHFQPHNMSFCNHDLLNGLSFFKGSRPLNVLPLNELPLEASNPPTFPSTTEPYALAVTPPPTQILFPCPQKQSRLGDHCVCAHSHHYVYLPVFVATFASESLCYQTHESERQGMVFVLIPY